MTMRRTRMTIAVAVVALGGCLCDGDPVTATGYASMEDYGPQITACIVDGDCELLCADKFGIGDDIDIVRCEITSIDRRAPGTSKGANALGDVAPSKAIERRAPG